MAAASPSPLLAFLKSPPNSVKESHFLTSPCSFSHAVRDLQHCRRETFLGSAVVSLRVLTPVLHNSRREKKLPLFFTRHWEEKIKRIENRTFEGERELFKSFEDRRRPFLRVFMAAKALNRLRSRRARGSVDERRENPNVSREETAASTGSRNRLDSITESVPGRRESREDCERATTLRALRLRDVAERTRPSRHNEFQPISRKIGALDSTLSHGGRNTSLTPLESRQQRVSVR